MASIFDAIPGWKARRQPGSGVYQDFAHDVFAERDDGIRLIIEAKSWRYGWRTGDSAMGGADLLVIKRDHGEPMAYLSVKLLADLIRREQSAREAAPARPKVHADIEWEAGT